MNIYVINMDKDTQRLNKITQSAKKYEINFTRVSGVLINDEIIKTSPFVSDFMKKYGTKGIIGSFLAHKKVWEIIVNDKIDYAVILEDDIEFTPQFNTTLEQIKDDINNSKLDFDILLLSSLVGCKNPKNYNFVDMICRKFMRNTKYQYINEMYHIPEFFAGVQSYVVTYESAKKILAELSVVNYYVDLALTYSKNIKKISLNKPIIKLSDDNCEISNNATSPYLLDKILKKINIYNINLSWILNISICQIPVPLNKTPIVISPRFILKYLFILFLTILLVYYNIVKEVQYWCVIILLYLIIIIL
jgi:glycosyl transferase family 25